MSRSIFPFLKGILLIIVLVCGAHRVQSHPWGGLVIDASGDIYFTFICPFTSDDHYACVWKLSGGKITPDLESAHSPSDIILARNNNRALFAAERTSAGPVFQSRLWAADQGTWQPVIAPTSEAARFHIQAYAVDTAGTVYFARDALLFQRDSLGAVRPVPVDVAFERIDLMAWGPDETLYLLDRGTLYTLSPETGTVARLATNLRAASPEHLPFSGANILFDMTVDAAGAVYLAYYGNRSVLKVTPSGEVSTFLQSVSPWSPHGIDSYNGDIYILESTVGAGKWWKFWGRPVIVPRVRKINSDGTVTTVFEYSEEE